MGDGVWGGYIHQSIVMAGQPGKRVDLDASLLLSSLDNVKPALSRVLPKSTRDLPACHPTQNITSPTSDLASSAFFFFFCGVDAIRDSKFPFCRADCDFTYGEYFYLSTSAIDSHPWVEKLCAGQHIVREVSVGPCVAKALHISSCTRRLNFVAPPPVPERRIVLPPSRGD